MKVSLRNATLILSDPHRELSNTALRSKGMGKGKAFWKGDVTAARTGMLSCEETDANYLAVINAREAAHIRDRFNEPDLMLK